METPAIAFFGRDFEFPNDLPGLPRKLSDVADLKIGTFETSDKVSLSYWTAGQGEPLVFLPGWSSDGAEFINLIHVLASQFRVYVLDHRNHGLSQKVAYGNRIARLSADLHELLQHVAAETVNLCGWSMGCAVAWGYIDLFGTGRIAKLALIDEPPSIYCHSNWTEDERVSAGAFSTSAERQIDAFRGQGTANQLQVATDIFDFYTVENAPAFENSQAFAEAVAPKDMQALERIMFDNITNDWRDVLAHKIDVPTLVFSGEHSSWVESQRRLADALPDGRAIIYGKNEDGDHFLHLKNPIRFSNELAAFLKG